MPGLALAGGGDSGAAMKRVRGKPPQPGRHSGARSSSPGVAAFAPGTLAVAV